MIDVVFVEDREVRLAWRHFVEATELQPFSGERVVERYLAIVEKMARALGLSDNITVEDVKSSYYPVALGHLDEATYLEALDKRARFKPPA
jgi:hypothetical protein